MFLSGLYFDENSVTFLSETTGCRVNMNINHLLFADDAVAFGL